MKARKKAKPARRAKAKRKTAKKAAKRRATRSPRPRAKRSVARKTKARAKRKVARKATPRTKRKVAARAAKPKAARSTGVARPETTTTVAPAADFMTEPTAPPESEVLDTDIDAMIPTSEEEQESF